jgi:hypothetical protein
MDMIPKDYKPNALNNIIKPKNWTPLLDKQQLAAKIYHILLQCKCGWRKISTDATSLQEMIELQPSCPNTALCSEPGIHAIKIMPAIVRTQVTIKCTECEYRLVTNTTKTQSEISTQTYLTHATHNRKIIAIHNIIDRCNYKCCTTCRMAYRGNVIDLNNEKTPLLKINCTLINIIYCIYCQKCKKWYIGHTTRSLKERMAIHKCSIRRKDNTAIARHFNLPGHSIHTDFKIAILDKCDKKENLRLMEAIWINKLNLVSMGINERDEGSSLNEDIMQSATHFHHSRTCRPYILFHTLSITINPLLKFKRHNVLHATQNT